MAGSLLSPFVISSFSYYLVAHFVKFSSHQSSLAESVFIFGVFACEWKNVNYFEQQQKAKRIISKVFCMFERKTFLERKLRANLFYREILCN